MFCAPLFHWPAFLSKRRKSLTGFAALLLVSMAAQAQHAPKPSLTVLLEELPPYSYADSLGQPNGYSVDLARELLTRAKLEARFEFNSWARIIVRGRSDANVLIAAITRLPEREQQFVWLGQIATRRGTLYRLHSRPDLALSTLADAKTYRIAVVKDDVSERELIKQGFDPILNFDRSNDYVSMLRRFFAGRADLLALNQVVAPALLKQLGYDVGLIDPLVKFSDSKPSMALSLGTEEAVRLPLKLAWDAMKNDGSMAAIAARYGIIVTD
jgi:polar amino acid transport system substrate-binding protein